MNEELDKIAEAYAHDYREMPMYQNELKKMLQLALHEAYKLGRKEGVKEGFKERDGEVEFLRKEAYGD